MTNKQREAKIHRELISQWPTCYALWNDAAFGRSTSRRDLDTPDDTMGMRALHSAGHGEWQRPTMSSDAELVPLNYRVTNTHINWWRAAAEKELKKAIERSGELQKEIFSPKKKAGTSKMTKDRFWALAAELEKEYS